MKGIIALDIDGTITVEHHSIEPEVVRYLSGLAAEGWKMIFITGRTFHWGYSVLRFFPFPYDFAVQNGAIILEMPTRRIVSKKYLHSSIFPVMDSICKEEPGDYIVYAGYEHGDRCFYRPERFDPPLLDYLKQRTRQFEETWIPVHSFADLEVQEFPSVKYIGLNPSAQRIAQKIEEHLGLHVPLIRDPFNAEYYVAQATHALVSKGHAVMDFKKIIGCTGPVIAAGDDNNDRTMLAVADAKVVMASAPQDMLAMADVIAPPATERGIIAGLTEAIKRTR